MKPHHRPTVCQQKRLLLPLQGLQNALDCAKSNGIDHWQLAVELGECVMHGILPSDVRWLIANQFVEHGRELTTPNDQQRRFDRSGRFTLSSESCLVLTSSGVALLGSLNLNGEPGNPASSSNDNHDNDADSGSCKIAGSVNGPLAKNSSAPQSVPCWDCANRVLKVGPRLVKQFRVPASNQEAILTVFQEEGWPAQIDDPLSPSAEIPAKSRLHSAITSLNRNQKHQLIRFSGNGTGDGVIWAFIDNDIC